LHWAKARGHWAGILFGFGLWTAYGLFSAALTHYRYSFSKHPISWPGALFIEGSYAYACALLTPLVIWLAQRFPLQRPTLLRNLSIHLLATCVFSISASLLWDLVNHHGAFDYGRFSLVLRFRSMDFGLDFAFLLYWLIVLFHSALEYYRRYEAGLVQTANLNAQLARAQLQALKMQLHPHFLFNTLHTISELIHEDPNAAERMIVGLSQLLRMSLDTSSDLEVPLHEELRFVELYLNIERARFESRLQVEVDIPDELRDALVPSLILQPLIENSIKHGIAHRRDGGKILIRAQKEHDSLELMVRDNGTGLPLVNGMGTVREGVGLGTTRARLEKLYGRNHTLYFIRRPGAGAEVTIRMPLKLNSMVLEHAQ
jgi:sensor histidine kinase YesM